MIISLRMLKRYVPIKETPLEIVDALTMVGIEVEGTIDLGAQNGKILVGEIKSIAPHPTSDKLSICQVYIGGNNPLLNIVCGAPNIKVGQKVPVAVIGAILPNGMKIEKAKIRGIESDGMLCSGKELEYNDDESGIMILPPDWTLGEPVDFLIDIKVTPNRADCLSLIGVARDLAAVFKRKITPPVPRFHESMDRIESLVKLTIDDKNACPKYTCRIIKGVKIGPSPIWLQRAVEAGGVRSINNVVDVTNFVLLELGHPLHAFDLDKIADHHIIVRKAKSGEEITTLDEQTIKLSCDELLIADPAKAIALAGIMGGLYSEIDDRTINVLLESAYFDPVTIRKSSKRLEKITDSSYRFERGTDIKNLVLALNRASQLIKEVAGGDIVKGICEVSGKIAKPQPVNLNVETLNKVLGTNLDVREIADELVSLNFELLRCDKNILSLSVPSYRVDIKREIDLIEEVARIYGYNKIAATMPYIPSVPLDISPSLILSNKVRDIFVSLGFNESLTYSFIGKEQIEQFDTEPKNLIEIMNPISKDQGIMRTTLIPGIINVFQHNMNHNILDMRIFEVGNIFRWNEKQTESVEKVYLAAGISGNRFKSWNLPVGEVDFYDIKGIAEFLLKAIGIYDAEIKRLDAEKNPNLHPYRCAGFYKNGTELVKFGELHVSVVEKYGLKKKIYILEASIENLLKFVSGDVVFKELPKFPGVARDLAIIVDMNVPVGEIEAEIKNSGGKDLVNLEVFDIYKGEQVSSGKKSIAFSLFFQSREKTLTEEMINKNQENILKALKEKFSAVLR